MKTGPRFSGTCFYRSIWIDSLKDFDKIEHAHGDSRFLEQLSCDTFQNRFAKLESATRNRPLAEQRFRAAADEQGFSVFNQHPADTYNGPLGVLARRRHLGEKARSGYAEMKKARAGFDLPLRGI